ncbi:hypothetical protein F5X71_28535 [Nocardia brasiliensis]|uniref:Uncharacterized protein n=1 Tax=Nocardia brasiliensis TaxID=37326 RepID=A0A6G9XXX3_NOCBR|nr:hypothetical protein [Nocardia brasiliensis]QIS05727.1 hypothetical protein F5X71_28535 [Nocardia brasiliensis]
MRCVRARLVATLIGAALVLPGAGVALAQDGADRGTTAAATRKALIEQAQQREDSARARARTVRPGGTGVAPKAKSGLHSDTATTTVEAARAAAEAAKAAYTAILAAEKATDSLLGVLEAEQAARAAERAAAAPDDVELARAASVAEDAATKATERRRR